jgi:long-chain acyl-CoA synthetase
MQNDRPWLAHYDPGVPATIAYPEQPLFAFLEETARKQAGRACTIDKDGVVSYGEMNEGSDRLAAALAGLGVEKGDRVGILMPNCSPFVMAFYAILKAGAVVVATNPQYTLPEIVRQVNDAGVEVMFVMSDLYATVAAAKTETPLRTLIVAEADSSAMSSGPTKETRSEPGLDHGDVDFQDLIAKYRPDQRPAVSISPDATALFQYSGGTTGVSKAAVASHRGVVANTVQFRTWLTTLQESKEIMLLAIPLYHAYGMIAGMSLGVALGASLAMVPSARDVPALIEAIDRFHPTVFPGVPGLYAAISNHPGVNAGTINLRSLRVCISGSTALLRETKERFEELSGGQICEGYGLSEAPVVTHCNPLLGVNKIGSIGMPMPDVDCRIVDPQDADKVMPPGESGELILRGPQVMSGYHNMPDETALTLRELSDGKTWLFTGDIVRADQDGYFYIVDRKKEVIKPGGFQVWPREVEEAIASHPKVLEVGVAGVPDPTSGEAVKAWIVVKAGENCSVEEIKAWCRGGLAGYKVPVEVAFVQSLPKSAVGKVLRRELVRQHKAALG